MFAFTTMYFLPAWQRDKQWRSVIPNETQIYHALELNDAYKGSVDRLGVHDIVTQQSSHGPVALR